MQVKYIHVSILHFNCKLNAELLKFKSLELKTVSKVLGKLNRAQHKNIALFKQSCRESIEKSLRPLRNRPKIILIIPKASYRLQR